MKNGTNEFRTMPGHSGLNPFISAITPFLNSPVLQDLQIINSTSTSSAAECCYVDRIGRCATFLALHYLNLTGFCFKQISSLILIFDREFRIFVMNNDKLFLVSMITKEASCSGLLVNRDDILNEIYLVRTNKYC